MLPKLNILPENQDEKSSGRFPSWLHRRFPNQAEMFDTTEIVQKYGLNTVCEEAKCPNSLECFSKKTATFLVLGKQCTRNCAFCDIDFSKTPAPPSEDEAERLAASVLELGLSHVVITMVARDDLPDGGAASFVRILEVARAKVPHITLEVLTSDFNGNKEALDLVLNTHPEIFNHNMETVRRLTPQIRHKSTYERSLDLLKHAVQSGKSRYVKSGIMVGLGETDEEVRETLRDLHQIGCQIVTIGHYLQASRKKVAVKSFISPEQFDRWADYGRGLGIAKIYAAPFVRSSYNAVDIFRS